MTQEKAHQLANTFFMFASFKPRRFGKVRYYAREDIEELVVHYEDDFIEAVEMMDEEHLTRIA